MQYKELLSWAALNSIRGMTARALMDLRDIFGAPEAIFKADYENLIKVSGIGPYVANEIKSLDVEQFITQEERLIKQEEVHIVSIEDDIYPEGLRTIDDPPLVLYVRGKLKKEDDLFLSVVGSRKPTHYGTIVTGHIVSKVVDIGITVISGMARGIDSLAHKAALENGGRTIAVMGCGLLITYPPENKKLKEAIVQKGGAIISEFAMTTKPEKMNFPRRNRLISGLSYGTLVVEATAKSGSLITAVFALEQGREVYAVPGDIHSANSRGCHKLLKEGAKLVENIDDIKDGMPHYIKERVKESQKGFDVACQTIKLSDSERSILTFLNTKHRHIDDLIKMSELSSADVLNILTRLELIGAVRQLSGKMFASAIDSNIRMD